MTSSDLLSTTGSTTRRRSLKSYKSVENLRKGPVSERDRMTLRKASNDSSHSSTSLPNVAAATSGPRSKRRDRTGSFNLDAPTQDVTPVRADSLDSLGSLDGMVSPTKDVSHQFFGDPSTASSSTRPPISLLGRRSAPPAPPKRRKPPAVPTSINTTRTHGGATITTIASTAVSVSSPLSQHHS